MSLTCSLLHVSYLNLDKAALLDLLNLTLIYNTSMKKIVHSLFCLLARMCIARHKPFVIGITGSFGKTTARHIITEILKRAGRDVWTPEGNYNGEWGLALAVLQVRSGGHNFSAWMRAFFGALVTLASSRYPHILVLEYGVDHAGEMDVQTLIVEPHIALFTKLSPSHIEGFENAQAYYDEKEKLLSRKNRNTFAIGNADDRHQNDFLCQKWYGVDAKKSDLVITNTAEFADRTEMDFTI